MGISMGFWMTPLHGKRKPLNHFQQEKDWECIPEFSHFSMQVLSLLTLALSTHHIRVLLSFFLLERHYYTSEERDERPY